MTRVSSNSVLSICLRNIYRLKVGSLMSEISWARGTCYVPRADQVWHSILPECCAVIRTFLVEKKVYPQEIIFAPAE
ncbi:MAG: hypothetical protein R8G34_06190 [Paracoccaceae bacterium]|nr:hypothetical protein [Paracoccaceae bacterium]